MRLAGLENFISPAFIHLAACAEHVKQVPVGESLPDKFGLWMI
jgi:hypothetical protein